MTLLRSGRAKSAFKLQYHQLRASGSNPFKYVQGQYNHVNPKIREYFYYVDHNGMLFLDDARMKNFTSCFKEKKFLNFFFTRIKRTEPHDAIPELQKLFPYTSHCGRERNYIRVDATPFVFSNFTDPHNMELNYTGATRLFNPSSLYQGSDGRLYHEFQHDHIGFALIRSQVADLIFSKFVYEGDTPVSFKDGDAGLVRLSNSIGEMVERVIGGDD